ncbi:hypothetical protein BHM03_00016599, partial [Ensete ventricosum]
YAFRTSLLHRCCISQTSSGAITHDFCSDGIFHFYDCILHRFVHNLEAASVTVVATDTEAVQCVILLSVLQASLCCIPSSKFDLFFRPMPNLTFSFSTFFLSQKRQQQQATPVFPDGCFLFPVTPLRHLGCDLRRFVSSIPSPVYSFFLGYSTFNKQVCLVDSVPGQSTAHRIEL